MPRTKTHPQNTLKKVPSKAKSPQAMKRESGNALGEGVRFNLGKPPMTLISPLAKRGQAQVLDWARKHKYAGWNWAQGLDIADVCDSLERHLDDIRMGRFIDEDTGLPIVDHIQCNAMFLSHFWHAQQWQEFDKNMPYQFTLFPAGEA